MTEPKRINVTLVGNSGTGKTTLMKRMTRGDTYKIETQPTTIGIDYGIVYDDMHRIHIWDTGGELRYRSITRSYFRDCDCVIIVVKDSPTLYDDIANWYHYVIETVGNLNIVPIIGLAITRSQTCTCDMYKLTGNGIHFNFYSTVNVETNVGIDDLISKIVSSYVPHVYSEPIILVESRHCGPCCS